MIREAGFAQWPKDYRGGPKNKTEELLETNQERLEKNKHENKEKNCSGREIQAFLFD